MISRTKSLRKTGNALNIKKQKEVLLFKRNERVLDLEKIANNSRNVFWKQISAYKKQKRGQLDSDNGIDLEQFASYYTNLFSSSKCDDEGQKVMTDSVNEKLESISDLIYHDVFKMNDLEESIKALKSGKAFGHDNISAEMLKNVNNRHVIILLMIFYNDLVKYGLKLENFNVSVITPIPNKRQRPETLLIIGLSQYQVYFVQFMKNYCT